jgi:hypothetical protein
LARGVLREAGGSDLERQRPELLVDARDELVRAFRSGRLRDGGGWVLLRAAAQEGHDERAG